MAKLSYCGLILVLCLFNAVKSTKVNGRLETNLVMLSREFEWKIESRSEMNLTQYLIEKGQIESPPFDLQDSAKSKIVMRMSHLPETTQVTRYFSLRSGGPLKTVFFRLSLVNQFLTSKDLQTFGYSKELQVGDSLGISFWSLQDLTDYNKNGAIVFKLELNLLDRISQMIEQKITQAHSSNIGGETVISAGIRANPRSLRVTEFSTPHRVFEWRFKMGPGLKLDNHFYEMGGFSYIESSLFDLGDSNNTKLAMRFGRLYSYNQVYLSFVVISGGPVPNVTCRFSLVNQLLLAEDISKSHSGVLLTTADNDKVNGETYIDDNPALSNPAKGFIANGELLFKLEFSFFDGIKNSRRRGTKSRQ